MKIDLSIGAELSSFISIKIDEIAKETRQDYTELISTVSQKNNLGNNIDWWVQSPSSRNTIASPLFYYLCVIRLINRLISDNHHISEIIVDSFALKIIIRDLVSKRSVRIPVHGPNNSIANRLHRIIKNIEIVFNTLKDKLYLLIFSRRTKNLQKPMIDGSLTLIDTFVYPGYISKDRYYNGLWKNLSKDQRSLTYFVPTLNNIPTHGIISAYEELRKSDRNFLIKEDYFNFYDLLFAILHCFRILFIKVKSVFFEDLDVSTLMIEEMLKFNGFPNAVESLLNFRFAKALKKKQIKLKLVVNWFENQVVDKGWNAGFSRFYPKTHTLGYRGYITSDLYLCTLPSKCENINKLIPKEIAVIGKGLCDSIKEFDSTLKIKVVPAFRFSHLWEDYESKLDSKKFTIFFPMPYSIQDSQEILQALIKSSDFMVANDIRITLKSHPTMSIEDVKNLIGSDYFNIFSLVDEPFIESLSKSNLLISGLSGAAIESIVFGIPVLLLRNRRGITFNPIPKDIPQGIWSICDSSDQIIEFIKKQYTISNDELMNYKKFGKQVRERYFEPINNQSVYNFLEFESN